MKDFLGRDIKVEDKCVFVHRKYQQLVKGTVKKINNVTIWIEDAKGEATQRSPQTVVIIGDNNA